MIRRMLSKLALFRGVSPEEVSALARRARACGVARGDSFVRRGERLPGLCVLASGELKLVITTAERRERVLGLVVAPATFGEALALRRHPSSYDVVALAESSVLALPLTALERLAATLPRFSRNLIDLLAERALELQAELEATMLQRAPQRLASYLCSLAGASRDKVTLPVSKTLLAARLGVKKETLSRLLRQLSAEGVIEVSRRDIAIRDRAALARLSPGSGALND